MIDAEIILWKQHFLSLTIIVWFLKQFYKIIYISIIYKIM
jgi:hypothetical protein